MLPETDLPTGNRADGNTAAATAFSLPVLVLVWVAGTALLAVIAATVGRSAFERSLQHDAGSAIRRLALPSGQSVAVRVVGRTATLTGRLDPAAHLSVVQLVQGVDGIERLNDQIAVVAPPIPKVVTPLRETPSRPLVLGALRAVIADGSVVLEGAISDEVTRETVVSRLQARLGPAFIDRTTVGGTASEPLVEAFGRLVESGQESMTSGSIVLAGDSVVLLGEARTGLDRDALTFRARRLARRWKVVNTLHTPAPRDAGSGAGAGSVGALPVPTVPATSPSAESPDGTGLVIDPFSEAQARLDALLSDSPIEVDDVGEGVSPVSGLVLEEAARIITDVGPYEIEVDVRPHRGAPVDPDAAAAWSRRRAGVVVKALTERGVRFARWTPVGLRPDAPADGPLALPVRLLLKASRPTDTTLPSN